VGVQNATALLTFPNGLSRVRIHRSSAAFRDFELAEDYSRLLDFGEASHVPVRVLNHADLFN
jgi:hypothetical protein